jgi:hypothetical protein
MSVQSPSRRLPTSRSTEQKLVDASLPATDMDSIPR